MASSWLSDFIGGLIKAGGSYYINKQGAEAQADAANQAAAYQLAAAREAAAAQTRAAEIAANTQLQMYNSTVARSEPFRQASLAALPKQMYYAGVPGSGYSPNLGSLDPRAQQLQQMYAAAFPGSGGSVGDQSIYAQGLPSAGGSAGGGLPAPGLGSIGGGNVSSPDGMAGLMAVLSALPPGTLDLVLDKLGVGTLEEAISQGAQKVGEALGIVAPEALSGASAFAGAEVAAYEAAIAAGLPEQVAQVAAQNAGLMGTDAAIEQAVIEVIGPNAIASGGAFAAAEAAAYTSALAATGSEQVAMIAAQNAGLMGADAAVSSAISTVGGSAVGTGLAGMAAGVGAEAGISAGAIGGTAAQFAAGGTAAPLSGLGAMGVAAIPAAVLAYDKLRQRDPKPIFANYGAGELTTTDVSGGGNGRDVKSNVGMVSTELDPIVAKLRAAGYTGNLHLMYMPNNDPGKPGYYKFADPSTYQALEKPDYNQYNNLGDDSGMQDYGMAYQRAQRKYQNQFGGGADNPGYYNGQKLDYSKAGSFRDPDAFVKWYLENVPKDAAPPPVPEVEEEVVNATGSGQPLWAPQGGNYWNDREGSGGY